MPKVTADSTTITLPDGQIELSWAAVTHRGRRRDVNQDAVLAQFPLFVVADGMGGHVGGEIASTSTVARMRELAESGSITAKALEKSLARAVKDIASHPDATDEATGTTVTGVFLDTSRGEPHWVTLNIGDSRVYLVRDGMIAQLTTDHSVVQELVAAGRLSPEEAENHPYGNVITRAVGPSESVTPDYVRVEIAPGDRFVICSDGLTKELTDYGIRHFLDENPDPADAVRAMLDAALENGGRDNISIIVLNVGGAPVIEDDADDEDESDTAEWETVDDADDETDAAADEPAQESAAADDGVDSSDTPVDEQAGNEGDESSPESR
ncbi:PP2C family protein-serine/threonine phosphatase [Microbacterium sp.]|uniref:PP2C family protein-serine/threonine phosphatase n=1 Tax=Microbacterium sp. TaxID=51671 RepID=UPI002D768252|nr:protein phosphatase 2C domain-containing protein [Microbacterium sp.]HET6301994.1 protein phosphatase 2C domain-containing protein [Microbacterium sp.]